MNFLQKLIKTSMAVAVVTLAAGSGGLLFADSNDRTPSFQDAVGSWWGRAIPLNTVCQPAPGCPVPAEIVMTFTINADGTFIGIDSNIFKGGNHSTAHGQWVRSGNRSVKAAFTLLQSSPEGVFIGGFKNLFDATLIDVNKMEGQIHAYLYLYADANGNAVVDAEGLPTPSPLGSPAACATTPGCLDLGTFSFKVRRVSVP